MFKAIRWILISLLLLVLLLVLIVVVVGWKEPRAQYFDVDVEPVAVPDDPGAIARGEYLSKAVAVCVVCHGEDLGGKDMSASMIFGRVFTPNLTAGEGGVGRHYSDLDWVRAIRHGLAPDGRALAFMPVDHYQYLTDDDLGAMIAYLKSLPPVNNQGTVVELGFIARAIMNSGVVDEFVRSNLMDHQRRHSGGDLSPGAYLVAVGGCDFCHGPNLQGGQGPEPGAPPGPDITGTGRVGEWDFGTFSAVMLAGALPEGRQINPAFMPWKGYSHMSAQDLQILFDYLRSLPAENN